VGATERSTTATATASSVQTALPAVELDIRQNGSNLPSSVDSQDLPKPIFPVQDVVEPKKTKILGPHLRFDVAVFVFVVTIVLLFFCIDGMVNSVSALMKNKALSETFVGMILLPIPNCDFAPISLAVDDSLEQTMKYTVGRSIQTALLVEPMVVLIAWWINVSDVTLAFDGFEVVSLFTTILLLNFLVIDAKVHWVHGVLLLADWVLIGIAAYFVTPEASN
jgi:Ca2+:H+ antiporter